MINIPYKRFSAGAAPLTLAHQAGVFDAAAPQSSLVSCLMVTRGNMALIRQSYAGFKSQTWQQRELVIVCDQVSEPLRALARADPAQVRLVEVPAGLALGDLRNISIAHSRGDFVCQWDDDDLYDPRRVAVCMQLLTEAGVDAVFLGRWLIWWEARNLLCLSGTRIWEGSMLASRSAIPVYPALSKGEDTLMCARMLKRTAFALIDYPQLFCYRITGENTWDEAHFDGILKNATQTFRPEEHEGVFRLQCFAALHEH